LLLRAATDLMTHTADCGEYLRFVEHVPSVEKVLQYKSNGNHSAVVVPKIKIQRCDKYWR
jgi:hypothetical protein